MTSEEPTRNVVDDYIAGFPPDVQEKLQAVRATIRETAPEAEETIKYGIPTYVQDGNLVHFGGFKHHIGFYPAPSGLEEFKADLARYKGSKGTVQFPLNEPIPHDLIRRIVLFRVQENLQKAQAKGAKRS